MLRLVKLAHRVLSKPCDADTLKSAVRRACALQELLRHPPLVQLVGQLGSLPTPPALYNQIGAELEKPDGSIVEVGNLIAQDIGLAAKLLQMANSSLLGLRTTITSPVQAVQVLGTETTKGLVMFAEVFTCYDPKSLRPYSIDDLWDHSRAVADLAAAIAQTETDRVQAAEARLVGLLHDVGRLILATQVPADYRRALRMCQTERLPLVDAEQQVFGASHAEVGAYLLALWGLPDLLVEAVAWHHTPSRCPTSGFGSLTAIHAAEAILAPDEHRAADDVYFRNLGFGDRLPVWTRIRDAAPATGRKA
jgi:putative nucleotidyltransferase with HDIG domain